MIKLKKYCFVNGTSRRHAAAGTVFIIFLALFSINSIAQNPDVFKFSPPTIIPDTIDFDSVLSKFDEIANDSDKTKDHYEFVDFFDVPPTFPGGVEALYKFLYDNINYPDSSKKAGIQGTVVTLFTVDTLGRLRYQDHKRLKQRY
jgi:hypothetical protein